MRKLIFTLCMILATAGLSVFAQTPMDQLHGDFSHTANGLHAGNQFRTTFYNDGTFGVNERPPDIGGEWPINSGHIYMLDGNVFVGSEVIDDNGALQHIVSEVRGPGSGLPGEWSSGDTGPAGEWWTFLPLPGFHNPEEKKIAMSKWPEAWPETWPDKLNDPVDPGWPGAWNGYFGKDVFNADEESYFVSDDYANHEFAFTPDPTQPDRGGLGLRMYVRGFQWSNVLVEDALFALFDIENIGQYSHDKMVFSYKFGNNMGDTETAGDGGDDNGAFTMEQDIAYLYDYDDIGAGGWTPVGYFGGAFLESPGNPFDGIDNDGDGADGSGAFIDESMFVSRTLAKGDQVVIINYETFERSVVTLGDDTLRIPYQDLVYKFWAGKTVEEIPHNLVDDNLNGIIDENDGVKIGEGDASKYTYLYVGLKYVDYISGNGLDNPLMEERRDDRVDNDNDWLAEFDDLGQDGKANTNDPGEGDGVPTNGEPHFDKTDIDETDMIGLSSFKLYRWEDMPHYEDELVWDNNIPGTFDDLLENTNVELLYGSGYFPMAPDQVERFSMGIICGISLDDFLTNGKWVAKAYNENYNFSKAPNIPKLTAIPGDGMVTLYWDDIAERSIDPIAGEDFEGYRIYRSTSPDWTDMTAITDGKGSVTYRKPLAQFDIDNDIEGFAQVPVKGVRFYLGSNSGIVHSFIDSTVNNGQKYYYAVTSYDRGLPEGGVAPTECSKFISISTAGEVDKGANVAIVRPEAPANGYVGAQLEGLSLQAGGTATGQVGYKIIDPSLFHDGAQYRLSFEDTLIENDSRWQVPATKNFSLINLTTGDTAINKSANLEPGADLPMVDGFKLSLYNANGVQIQPDSTGWRIDSTAANFEPDSAGLPPYPYEFEVFRYSRTQGVAVMRDYRIDFFDEVGADTSVAADLGARLRFDAMPVNFTVTDLNTGEKIPFAFDDADQADGEEGMFTAMTGPRARYVDQIIFLEPNPFTEDTLSWSFTVDRASVDSLHRPIKAGDYFTVQITKPFTANDVFEFTTKAPSVDEDEVDLDRIKVVPNPYVVANSWEPLNPYANGRGPRELHFTHLPAQCTIKIFNVRGQLVRELEHNNDVDNGTAIWDMMTKDQLDIAYGVYIYHVDAGELGTRIGKFAVIK